MDTRSHGDDANDANDASPSEAAPAERRSTLSIVLVLAGIVAASTIIALLSGQTDQQPNPEAARAARQDEINRNVACPELRTAAARFAAGDYEGFVRAVERAGRVAESTLQRDGVVFGAPERAALQLSLLVGQEGESSRNRLQRLVSLAVEACSSTEPA